MEQEILEELLRLKRLAEEEMVRREYVDKPGYLFFEEIRNRIHQLIADWPRQPI